MRSGKILVTGATGTIGAQIVPQLLAKGADVRVLVRDPAKAQGFSGVEVVVGDLSRPETLPEALRGVDKLFAVSNGTNIAELEGNLYAAARDAKLERLVKISGRHLDADFMAGQPLAKNQIAAEAAARSVGVPWTIIRPGFFSSNFFMFIDWATRTFAIPVGDGRDTPTDTADIAAVGVEALLGDGHESKIYEITGPDFLSFPEMLRTIGTVTGRPVQQIDVPPEVVLQGMIASGVPETQARGLLDYFAAVRAGKVYPPTETMGKLLGRPTRSFGDWVRANAAALGA